MSFAIDPPRLSLLDARLWRHPEREQGTRAMLRALPGVAAWGLVTGMVMAQSGLPMWAAVLMSMTVFAASAQLAAIPLMLAGAPLWVVWLAALCVNLRFVIFSAQLRPFVMALPLRWRLVCGYLVADVSYVMQVARYPHGTATTASALGPLAHMVGLAAPNWLGWNGAALLGIVFAGQLPTSWGLAFAGTLTLAGLLASLVRDGRAAVAATLAGATAVACWGWPFKLNMVVAVAVGIAAGLLLDALPGRGRADA
ncbi:branched-chain amino acid ABC transporter permease [Aquabacterium olei]|uniref:Branched-chain amino acid ABC transporter permease n=1 Tax=Aquabacterium olei TaxID=1296669 RepID=A0A2U8FMI0_9BURK|nr:AzlC family ABC transporter permease [Aquabacterium olei]AWI52222.1 branched-chain amino acid ABC transporter permease [Aquabacterium olei]